MIPYLEISSHMLLTGSRRVRARRVNSSGGRNRNNKNPPYSVLSSIIQVAVATRR